MSNFGIPEISLRQLKSALYVAQLGSVTRASEKLNRSQTAITKAISDLEGLLDVVLFDRTPSGMMPTVYGQALAQRVEQAAGEFEAAGKALAQHSGQGDTLRSNPIFSMDISYKRLAAFIALYDKGDVSSAAQSLGIGKTALYGTVRQMEALLDTALFERQAHGVAPTEYCNVLARHTKLAFAQIRHAMDDIAGIDGATQGHVVIGTLPYSRTFLMPKAVNRLLAQHPQLSVSTRDGPYDLLETGLRSGDIDVIVGAIRAQAEGADICTEVLFEDRLAVIARKNHPLMRRDSISLQELQSAHWVVPAKGSTAGRIFDEAFAKCNMPVPANAVRTGSLSFLRGLLADSDRIALLSEHQIYYDKEYGVLDVLPVQLDDAYRPIGIILRGQTRLSPAAQLFLDLLREVADQVRLS